MRNRRGDGRPWRPEAAAVGYWGIGFALLLGVASAGALPVANQAGAYGSLALALFIWGAAGRALALAQMGRAYKEFEKKSMIDEHTGALSKARLLEAMEREMKSAKRKSTPLSVVMVEAMNIMEINQMFDRLEGDACLAAVALSAQSCLRDTDYLGRSGGLTFCAVLPETDDKEAFVVMKRVSAAMADIARSHAKGEVHVKARMMCRTWDGSEDLALFIARAEGELFNAPIQESHG